MAQFKCHVSSKGAGSRPVIIEAINAPQAREFAEARYPGCKIAGVNRVG